MRRRRYDDRLGPGEALVFGLALPPAMALLWTPPWLRGLAVLGMVVGVGTILVLSRMVTNRMPEERRRNFGMGGWGRALLVGGALAGGGALIIPGGTVVGASTLSAEPVAVRAISTDTHCRGGRSPCRNTVTYAWDGTRLTSGYPASPLSDGPEPRRFVVNPERPTRVMLEHDFRFGRGDGRWWLAGAMLLLLASPPAGAWLSARRARPRGSERLV